MRHYIYTLSDPRTKVIRYVGKTNNPQVRFSMHMCEKRNTHKNNWIRQLKSLGLKPVMEIIETIDCTADEWADRERFWIAHFRQMGLPLTNLDSGGNSGRALSEETKAKISAAHKGMKLSPESIAKMKATKAAGWTPERRANMGAHLKGKKQTPEMIAKRVESLKGRVCSEETRRKIGEANRRNYSTPEARALARERALDQMRNNPKFLLKPTQN